jgi:hypothetical protein
MRRNSAAVARTGVLFETGVTATLQPTRARIVTA